MGIKEIWIEFEQLVDGHTIDSSTDEVCNVSATLDDGRRYAFNVWTFNFLETSVSDCRKSGAHLSGLYLPAPDLFVERLDRPTIEKSLTHWLKYDGYFPEHLECSEVD